MISRGKRSLGKRRGGSTSRPVLESLTLLSTSPEGTRRIGARLGKALSGGEVLLLRGGLGVGKTCLVQGIARGLGVAEGARSPSFVIIAEYRGRLPLYHIDLYRLERPEEIASLGLEEYFSRGGVCVVEWAEKGLPSFPEENLSIRMSHAGPRKRSLLFVARGQRYQELLARLQKWS